MQVIADGSFFGEFEVSGGQITLPHTVENDEVGLGFVPLIKPLPVVIPSQEGIIAFTPRSIKKIYIEFFESLGIILNGVKMNLKQFGNDVLNKPPIPKTGTKNMTNVGISRAPQITLTQKHPLPMTILTVGYEMEM